MSYSDELYQQVILDHNKSPRNFKKLQLSTHQCEAVTLCVVIMLK